MSAAVRIPILNDEGVVHAHALVDADLSEDLGAYRWSLSHGYVMRWTRLDGESVAVRMHRLVLGLGLDDPLEPDHRNGDPLDNRRCNLRAVTHAENQRNMRWHRERRHHGVPEPRIVATLPVAPSRRGDPNGGQFVGSMSPDQVALIGSRRVAGERGRDLAAEFGISEQRVCDIHKGRSSALRRARGRSVDVTTSEGN